jgi:hypothetical protein
VVGLDTFHKINLEWEDAVREGVISKEASTYIQDTMEEIAADHGYI